MESKQCCIILPCSVVHTRFRIAIGFHVFISATDRMYLKLFNSFIGVIILSAIYFLTTTTSLYSGSSCFFYDKPPRTGSTTIAHALETCLLFKGYTSIHKPIAEIERAEVVSNMLSMPGRKFSAVIKHVEVSDEDIQMLRKECNMLFFLSSTRPMTERIASAAKYGMSKRHGSSTLTNEQYKDVQLRAKRDTYTEPELERYPFTGNNAIFPDYVIRSDNLDDDLHGLLQAMGCKIEYRLLNVHEFEDKAFSGEIKKSIHLNGTDSRFKELTHIAEIRNRRGLRRARQV